MKQEILVKQEIEVTAVIIHIKPRIGDDGGLPIDFPLLSEDKQTWHAVVDIDTGKIQDWPHGEARKMHVKVRDAGVYTLTNGAPIRSEVAVLNGYVPHGVVPGSYGDYVELSINTIGVIENWPRSPDISEFFEPED